MSEIRRYPPEMSDLAGVLFNSSSKSRRIRIGSVNPITVEDPRGRVVMLTGPGRVSIRSGIGNGGRSNFDIRVTGMSNEEALHSALYGRTGLRRAIRVYVAEQKKIK